MRAPIYSIIFPSANGYACSLTVKKSIIVAVLEKCWSIFFRYVSYKKKMGMYLSIIQYFFTINHL